ncbi:MAG: preprotein translocase subunit SecE [Planctomycetes bacterium]|nr:preprotein translocase subunit SecE [Planctomycetota bacterium]
MVIASVVALAGLAGVYLFIINLPRSAEFLICTEDELRKVSWPQRNEYVGSSIAVIISVASLGLFILLADSLLYKLMELLRII